MVQVNQPPRRRPANIQNTELSQWVEQTDWLLRQLWERTGGHIDIVEEAYEASTPIPVHTFRSDDQLLSLREEIYALRHDNTGLRAEIAATREYIDTLSHGIMSLQQKIDELTERYDNGT